MASPLSWTEVQRIVVLFLDAAAEAGQPLSEPLVLVGGSALAAHGVREDSLDVGIYTPNPPQDVAFRLERELEALHGEGFRLDVTGTENIWGNILLRDIATSPQVAVVEGGGRCVPIQALRLEDLFLLKVSAGRKKDRGDVALLGGRVTPEGVVDRFNQLLPWYGGTGGSMGFADAVVVELVRQCGAEPVGVIERMIVPHYVRTALLEAHALHEGRPAAAPAPAEDEDDAAG